MRSRPAWIADGEHVVPGQLRVLRAINKLDGGSTVRHFLFVIGDASEPAEKRCAKSMMKWLVLRSTAR